MIYFGIGANLHHSRFGAPLNTCGAALYSLNKDNIHILACSRWYESAPVPVSDQPNYVNAVVQVETALKPRDLLNYLLSHEEIFGRSRAEKNAARTLDLDLLDYNGEIVEFDGALSLPHPRLHERAFVLLPLAEHDQKWRHPQIGSQIFDLIKQLPTHLKAAPLDPLSGEYGTPWTPEIS
jgi:2-amino-4-hydroxy-6-hydroxymethyldihydropteridine diphosphokinase